MSTDTQPANQRSIVILVHGIRTSAVWMNKIIPVLKRHRFNVAATNYGHFSPFLFWFPFTRWLAIWRVRTDIESILNEHRDLLISFVAHSFGTYIVARILRKQFALVAHRVIFCGSILSRRFPFQRIDKRFSGRLLNEVAPNDPWPQVAKWTAFGFDYPDARGFMRPQVVDRFHQRFKHSDCLTARTSARNTGYRSLVAAK